MRIKHSIINISAGLINQLIITSLSFVSRTVFINTLGIEYLGINGLFTNILAMLSLAEAGIGASIMYSLYKPIAENDQEKITVLMKFYKNAYLVIALIVLLLGLILMPFLGYFTNNSEVSNVHLIYLIFLINTVAPYLFVYKNSFLNVSQKGYIVTGIYSVSSVISVCLKIAILHYTKNYILYLLIDCLITLINSLILVLIVNRKYPFLKKKPAASIDQETKTKIVTNIKAIILQNIGSYLVFGTDNIIISSFVSVAAVGLYSNYNMIIEICRTFINQVFNNIYHSVGNLVAQESKEKIIKIYNVYNFLNFWLYSFFSIFLLVMIEPLITVWIGPKFLMSKAILVVLILTFYERGMRNAITTVKTTSGIFREDKYAPLCQAAVNLAVSIILVESIGIVGVFLGTLVSALAVPFWTTPYFVYKKVFKLPMKQYLLRYLFYLIIGVGTCYITLILCNIFHNGGLSHLALKFIVCVIIPNLIYTVLFYRTNEFQYLFTVAKSLVNKLFYRYRPSKIFHY
ncbi:lipopolysaccharide biosynthesis protein [Peribacillus kribbensis]|uniref:lipopolysaccharide biosynthesis protein n=1 Tax=Peribacillus kribbensis TaxID=356658 RepID=UPI000478B2C2|nr:oligosaccharide flippase family protein [Peribacillus kribbensis]